MEIIFERCICGHFLVVLRHLLYSISHPVAVVIHWRFMVRLSSFVSSCGYLLPVHNFVRECCSASRCVRIFLIRDFPLLSICQRFASWNERHYYRTERSTSSDDDHGQRPRCNYYCSNIGQSFRSRKRPTAANIRTMR